MSKKYTIEIKPDTSKNKSENKYELDRYCRIIDDYGFKGMYRYGSTIEICDDGSDMDKFLMLTKILESKIGKDNMSHSIVTGEYRFEETNSGTKLTFIQIDNPSSDIDSPEDDFHGFYESDFYMRGKRLREGRRLITRKVSQHGDEYIFIKYAESKNDEKTKSMQ